MKRHTLMMTVMILFVSVLMAVGNKEVKKQLKISISKGKQWEHSFKLFGMIKITTTPQIVIWREDEEGNLIETLYLTGKMKKIGRYEALPYWAHKADYFKQKNQFDLITSASPKGSTEINVNVKLNQMKYRVCAEVNHSYDYNEFFPKVGKKHPKYSKTNGQASLIYKSDLILPEDTGNFVLKETGYGEANGSTGKLYSDISMLTTAREIVHYLGVMISIR